MRNRIEDDQPKFNDGAFLPVPGGRSQGSSVVEGFRWRQPSQVVVKPKSRFLRSLSHAWEGVCYAYKTQRNFRVQLAVAFAAIGIGLVLGLRAHDMALVVSISALVLFAELINTAIEVLLDQFIGTRFDPSVKVIKDLAAGSVLIVCFGSILLGIAIFLPYFIAILS